MCDVCLNGLTPKVLLIHQWVLFKAPLKWLGCTHWSARVKVIWPATLYQRIYFHPRWVQAVWWSDEQGVTAEITTSDTHCIPTLTVFQWRRKNRWKKYTVSLPSPYCMGIKWLCSTSKVPNLIWPCNQYLTVPCSSGGPFIFQLAHVNTLTGIY